MIHVPMSIQCVCGNISEPFKRDQRDSPAGWFSGSLFFDSGFKTISACSANCVEAAKKQYKAHYLDCLRGFFERIDDLKLVRR
jgi:hypothetical protein